MPSKRTLVRSLSVFVYGLAIFLVLSLFTPPGGALVAIPMATTLGVIAHATRTGRIAELGYATIGLWAGLLVFIASLGIWTELVAPRGVRPFDPVGVPGMSGAVGCVVGAYLLASRSVGRDEGAV
ncbi:hypothetical protein [Halovivax cerinus]|uniref:SPW repeat protein n=1 Tax=Halovivax cerinus TaxID=1487865 RepID=A0ABD5NT35_9EURY|nr:hypothetical protein [Halovivax cerinus]